jgi:hypothetical protein
MAVAFGKTPDEIVLRSFATYGFNRAIYLFGSHVDNLLEQKEEVESFGKKEWRNMYTLEEALEMASEDPKKPKLQGLVGVFNSLR